MKKTDKISLDLSEQINDSLYEWVREMYKEYVDIYFNDGTEEDGIKPPSAYGFKEFLLEELINKNSNARNKAK